LSEVRLIIIIIIIIIIMGLTPVSSPEGDIRGVSYFQMKVERNWWTVKGRLGREKGEIGKF